MRGSTVFIIGFRDGEEMILMRNKFISCIWRKMRKISSHNGSCLINVTWLTHDLSFQEAVFSHDDL